MNINKALVPVAALGATAILAAGAAPATAKDGDVVRRGACNHGATWKLKASPEHGRIELEAEVDTNRNGRTWHWVMKHNGTRFASGYRKTRAPSGSFEVRRVPVNLRGTDTFVFTARRVGSSQFCRGTIRF